MTMRKKNNKRPLILLLLLVVLIWLTITTEIVNAANLYGTPADLTGTRTTDSLAGNFATGAGLTGNKHYASDFGVSWNIVANPDESLTYTYTFFGVGDKDKDISHIVVEVSDDCIDDSCIWNATFNGAPIDTGDIEFGHNDGITSGMKFDVGDQPAVYRFDFNREPVWGHLAVKNGKGSRTCGDWPAVGRSTLACSNALIAATAPIAICSGLQPRFPARFIPADKLWPRCRGRAPYVPHRSTSGSDV